MPNSLRPVPIVTRYPHDLKPVLADYDFIQLAFGCRPLLVVVGAYLHGTLQHYEIVYLTTIVSVPGPYHSWVAKRKVGLHDRIIGEQISPILTEDFGKEPTLIDIFRDIEQSDSGQHIMRGRMVEY